MSFDTFKKIVDKARNEVKIRKIQLYVYSDPCLHPELDKFVEYSNSLGIPIYLSTMLHKTKCDFLSVIEARPAEFRISFSGWKNMHIYQGMKIDEFLERLDAICKLPRYPETEWTLFFHIYKDNIDEIGKARELANKYNLRFVSIQAIFQIGERIVEKDYTNFDRKTLDLLVETPEETISKLKVDTKYCLVQDKQITIDAEGIVYLCELLYEDRFQIFPFLTTSYKDLRNKIMNHPYCQECRIMGNHTYQYLYADAVKFEHPEIEANRKRYKCLVN